MEENKIEKENVCDCARRSVSFVFFSVQFTFFVLLLLVYFFFCLSLVTNFFLFRFTYSLLFLFTCEQQRMRTCKKFVKERSERNTVIEEEEEEEVTIERTKKIHITSRSKMKSSVSKMYKNERQNCLIRITCIIA